MTTVLGLWDLLILVVASFLPAIVYLSWVRSAERYSAEAWGPLLWAFAYGAFFATVIAAVVEAVLVALGTAVSSAVPAPEFVFLNGNSSLGALFLVLVIAPFVEEALKASGVIRNRPRFRMIADGPVFGASVGLGFGFFETFLYGLTLYLVGGLAAALGLVLVRSISSVLLHGSSTGMFGYGYGRAVFRPGTSSAGGYYLVAVAMHASYNFLASSGTVTQLLGFPQYASYADVVGLLAAILFVFVALEHVRTLIRDTDYPSLTSGGPNLRPPPAPAGRGNPPGR